MKLSEPISIKAKALSPIFIGNGETIKILSYIADEDKVHVINPEKFFDKLTEQHQEIYLQWIEFILNQLNEFDLKIDKAGRNNDLKRDLRRNKRPIEKSLSLKLFIEDKLKLNPIKFLKSIDSIAYSVKYASGFGDEEFKLHIRDTQYRPYVPGTELKGAIRTSILYYLLSEEQKYHIFENEILNFLRVLKSGSDPQEKLNKLKNINSQLEEKLIRGKNNDAKFDLLKFIQINDGNPIKSEDMLVQLSQSFGTKKFTKAYIETISQNSEFNFAISIGEVNPDNLWAFKELGLDKMTNLLSLSKIFNACYLRSKALLDEDLRYFSRNQITKNLVESIIKLKAQNQIDSPLLRLGSGQGFLGTTVNLQVKNKNPQLYDEAIREGVKFQRKGRWRTEPNNFPKTRRIICSPNEQAINFLGWLKLSKS